ncbi:MAG: hypothetical protein SPL30_00725 [Succinivibrio sp.]|nr:hypothetical protein [Succinivibrio sp.]
MTLDEYIKYQKEKERLIKSENKKEKDFEEEIDILLKQLKPALDYLADK